MWFVLAMLASWFYCVALEINKKYPFDSMLVVLWRCFIGALMMLLCFPFMYWPSNPDFYIAILISSLVSVWGMSVQYDMAAKHNGRVANLQQPICIVVTFLAWLFIDLKELNRLLSDYVYAGGVITSLALMIISMQFIRQNDASWTVLRRIFPVGVAYAGLGVVMKLFLDTGAPSVGVSLTWVFLGCTFISIASLVVIGRRREFTRAALQPKGIVVASAMGSGFYVASWVLSAVAVILAANPAYPTVVAALSPLWFAIYYTTFGIKDDFSPLAGLFLGASAVLLLLVTL